MLLGRSVKEKRAPWPPLGSCPHPTARTPSAADKAVSSVVGDTGHPCAGDIVRDVRWHLAAFLTSVLSSFDLPFMFLRSHFSHLKRLPETTLTSFDSPERL